MRLISHFKDGKLAYALHHFLLQEGIESSCDMELDPDKETIYRIWIIDEEALPAALEWLKIYEQNPNDPRFHIVKPVTSTHSPESTSKRHIKIDASKKQPKKGMTLTLFVIFLCSLLFFINTLQQYSLEKSKGPIALQIGMTSLQKEMLFDYPKYFADLEKFYEEAPIRSIEEIKDLSPEAQAEYHKIVAEPTWKGVADLISAKSLKGWQDLPPDVLFGKIRQGEFWRLFTPCLMHNGLFHILFNMCWVWVLGRQIEDRIGRLKMIAVILITGILPNIAQYLMGGPNFEGFSGVVVGMVGFIWMRQKIAPWEGYPLQRSVILFITIFVFAMLGLEVLSFILQYLGVVELVLPIANTAHIVGGLVGILCARLPVFARGKI
ncbi:MAG: rhomboid family intramembrane serine protease [Rhabdochlamydiaceae bacterium]|jgi:GlpG protein